MNPADCRNRCSKIESRWLACVVLLLPAALGCAEQLPQAPAAEQEDESETPVGCRVQGRIISTAWRELGGGIERAIVSAWTVPGGERVEDVYQPGEAFEFRLPPGRYKLMYSAVGTQGATFEVRYREITVAEDQDSLDVGEADLPLSKTTRLYGKPAPKLTGIIAWQDTSPIVLENIRGQVIVLDFFAYTCSICHAHKPDLAKLLEKYGERGLIVVAVHDDSLKSMDEVNAKMDPILRNVFQGDPPPLPIALDGSGDDSVFESYGIYAVPAVILIDQEGRVVRRYHHAGKPELAADVERLLTAAGR